MRANIAVFRPSPGRLLPYGDPGSRLRRRGNLAGAAGMARGHSRPRICSPPRVRLRCLLYHCLCAISKRCAGMVPEREPPLKRRSPNSGWRAPAGWRNSRRRSPRSIRSRKPLWLTETADAACGGNPWGSTFLDSFRYSISLGRLARSGVQVVAHNTLASSDYGLLDENTLTRRPNYCRLCFGADSWVRPCSIRVVPAPALHLYAHCLRGHPGGVALLAINTGRTAFAIARTSHGVGPLHADCPGIWKTHG